MRLETRQAGLAGPAADTDTDSPPPSASSASTIPPGAAGGRECDHCGGPLAPKRRRFCSDICRVRGQRAERVTETGEFGRAAVRMIRAMAGRVGASDIAAFGAMWNVHEGAGYH
jgi:hypothetical protein